MCDCDMCDYDAITSKLLKNNDITADEQPLIKELLKEFKHIWCLEHSETNAMRFIKAIILMKKDESYERLLSDLQQECSRGVGLLKLEIKFGLNTYTTISRGFNFLLLRRFYAQFKNSDKDKDKYNLFIDIHRGPNDEYRNPEKYPWIKRPQTICHFEIKNELL